MKISFVILNFNNPDDTLECLKSLSNLKTGNHEILKIVVDNNSTDNSWEKLSRIKDIIFIRNEKNLGYSGGNNVGINKALEEKCDLILILNNDTIADPQLLLNIVSATKAADILCPKIYFAPGYEFHKKRYKKSELGKVIWFAGGKIDWDNIMGVHIGVDKVDIGQFGEKEETEYATGACFLAKKEVFEKIGLFDEKYFLYLEDMDFSVRAKKAGFKIVFEPKAILWHKNAASAGGSGSAIQDYFISRNRLLFALKYAKLRTKLALLRESLRNVGNPVKRIAFYDFLTGNFGKGSLDKL